MALANAVSKTRAPDPALLVDVHSPEPPTAASVVTAAKVSVILIVAAEGLSNRFPST
jgi:hypothetical protein